MPHFKSISKNNYTKSTFYNESANILRNMSINKLELVNNFSYLSRIYGNRNKLRFIPKKEALHNIDILMHSLYITNHKILGSMTTILLGVPFRKCSYKKAKLSSSLSSSIVKRKITFEHLSDDELYKCLEGGIKRVGF